MVHKIVLLNFLILPFLFTCCNSIEPPPDGQAITLTLEDVSCIEAWLKLTTTNLQLPTTVTLKQNDQTRSTINLDKADTLLYIDSLLPNQTYSFHATMHPSNHTNEVKSNVLSVTTLDTTSHNFSWQTWTFGEHSSSTLYDVAIINENNIWAVGEIYLNDSLGQPDPTPYNAVVWNGIAWEIFRIPTKTFSGTVVSAPIKTIYTFGENDIWTFSIAGSYSHWNGNNWETEFVNERDGSGNRLWGTSSFNLHLVNNNGGISYYNGAIWQRMDTGTDVDLLDVWGNSEGAIWACGYNNDYSLTTLLRNVGNGWETVYEGGGNNQSNGHYIGPISGVWGTGNFIIYMMNWGGIYIQANSNVLFLEKEIAKFSDVGFGIDGSGHNNIVACGEGFVGHWNGISYVEYTQLYKDFRAFYSVSVKEKTVCGVGSDYNGFINSEAVISLGRR